jgi:hypothetical protein
LRAFYPELQTVMWAGALRIIEMRIVACRKAEVAELYLEDFGHG